MTQPSSESSAVPSRISGEYSAVPKGDQPDSAHPFLNDELMKIGGVVETVRQYLRAGLIDELQVAFSPIVLGKGEALFAGIDLPALGFRVSEHRATEHATHIVLRR